MEELTESIVEPLVNPVPDSGGGGIAQTQTFMFRQPDAMPKRF